ncbi:unnamed protein product [Protopolystoma xenopodis]|uniref:Secreted protein n=1 Tax=Protopolystoma xenopodis TaxID=117903 RepID=A0A448XFN4_9PLAT|nr:unnamed protein product [Protopolystoma xenopodis]
MDVAWFAFLSVAAAARGIASTTGHPELGTYRQSSFRDDTAFPPGNEPTSGRGRQRLHSYQSLDQPNYIDIQ